MNGLKRLWVVAMALGATMSVATTGHAQSGVLVVKCGDPSINQAYIDLYQRDPVVRNPAVKGSVDGECNPALYGHGRWNNYSDLETKIMAVSGPRKVYNPATTQAYQRPKSSNTGSISSMNSSGGPQIDMSRGVVVDSGASTPLSQAQFVDQSGNLLSAAAVAAIVAQGGGNIVAQGGGNFVGSGPSNYRVGGATAPKKTYMLIRKTR